MSAAIEINELREEIEAELPPIATRFRLETEISPTQRAFLDYYGFIIFDGAASQSEVDGLMGDLDDINERWIHESKKFHFGIPIFWGKDEAQKPFVQRFCFTSLHSERFRDFVHDARFAPVRGLIGDNVRIGDREKDGVVVNRYINTPGSVVPNLGWHTDGLRDIFYGRMPKRMLNVGMHFDTNDALRLIPRTQEQGVWKTCFHKLYFLSHAPDPHEIAVQTRPGDLTVHDGRLWHRVERAKTTGMASLRRTMYVPYLTDPVVQLKDEQSETPAYHRLGMLMRRLRLLRRAR